jgi:hypothetical protein
MAGFTTAFSRTTLDSAIANGDKVHWSENGSSASANLTETTITTWKAASDADPAVRANDGAYESAGASSGCTITHYAVFNSAGSTQKTDWTALDAARTLPSGGKITIADGAITVTLT